MQMRNCQLDRCGWIEEEEEEQKKAAMKCTQIAWKFLNEKIFSEKIKMCFLLSLLFPQFGFNCFSTI